MSDNSTLRFGTLYTEEAITGAVKRLLTRNVNDILRDLPFQIPLVEIGAFKSIPSITPAIVLFSCEQTEKERIIRLDTYALTITFSLPDTSESELHCYAYADAFCKALGDDVTLGGVADRVIVTGKKYVPPKKLNCGMAWEVIISLRVTVEQMSNEK